MKLLTTRLENQFPKTTYGEYQQGKPADEKIDLLQVLSPME